jgi:hypothetical protein
VFPGFGGEMINGLSSSRIVLSPSNPISVCSIPDSMFCSMVSSIRVPVSISIALWVEVSPFCCFFSEYVSADVVTEPCHPPKIFFGSFSCFEFPLNLPLLSLFLMKTYYKKKLIK